MAKYGVKEVADVTLYDLTTGLPVLFLDTLKISSIENKADTAYARGGKGNPRLLAWNYNREATIKVQDALMSMKSLGLLVGNNNATGVKTLTKRELLTTVAGTPAIANPTVAPVVAAAGTGGTLPATTYYVRYTWVNGTGETLVSSEVTQVVTSGQTLTTTIPALPAGATSANVYIGTSAGTGTKQGSTATTTFTQSSPLVAGSAAPVANTATARTQVTPTKLPATLTNAYLQTDDILATPIASAQISGTNVTFDGVVDAPVGTNVVVFYTFNTDATAQTVTITSDHFPGYFKLVGDTVIRNNKTGLDEAFQFIIWKAKLEPTFNMEFKADGEPTMFDMTLDAFRRDADTEMIELIKY